MNQAFSKFAAYVSRLCGKPHAFILALAIIIVWALTGPYYDYSELWQILINTGTTIITFLLVFLLQNTQSRDNMAMQLKLDELIRVDREAKNTLIDIEQASDEELQTVKETMKSGKVSPRE